MQPGRLRYKAAPGGWGIQHPASGIGTAGGDFHALNTPHIPHLPHFQPREVATTGTAETSWANAVVYRDGPGIGL